MQNLVDSKSKIDKFASLKNKTAIVTGSSRGIGKEISLEFLRNKATVIGISSGKSDLTPIKHKNYFHFYCDLQNNNEILDFIFKIKKEFKKVDILVNNAGITQEEFGTLNENLENFQKTIQVNLISAYLITKGILQNKKNIKSIINISSIGGILGFPNNPAYQSSKAAIIGLTKSIARDFGKFGVNCNAILPGYFKTKMNQKSYQNFKKRKQRSDLTMLGRWGELHELIGTVMFLASNNAKYITGQSIIVDGGISAKGL